MRFSFIIICLTAVAAGLVHFRREQLVVRHERQQLDSQHSQLRREIWDRQVELSHLLTPQAIKHRTEQMALELTSDLPAQARADDAWLEWGRSND